MASLRPIAAALLAFAFAAPYGATSFAEPLERQQCDELKVQQQTLLTATVNAALKRGPDWVKENLHDPDKIEQVRKYLQVEEMVAFRCRTDGVRVPKPEPPSLPDRKPPVPTYVIAGIAATSLIPLRNPSREASDTDASDAIADVLSEDEGVGDADEPETSSEEESADEEATATDTKTVSDGADAAQEAEAAQDVPGIVEAGRAATGTSQAVAESDKTAPSEHKATQ